MTLSMFITELPAKLSPKTDTVGWGQNFVVLAWVVGARRNPRSFLYRVEVDDHCQVAFVTIS